MALRQVPAILWRRPLTSLVLSLLAAVLLIRVSFGIYLSIRVNRELAKVREAGHPTAVHEMKIETVPDAQNAWLAFTNASNGLAAGVESPSNSMDEYPNYPPYGDRWMKRAAKSEQANARIFPIARSASKLQRSQHRTGVPTLNNLFTLQYNRLRTLANTLIDGAELSHANGDDAEALERAYDVLCLGRSTRHDPLLISQLVGWGIEALALDRLEKIAPTLSVKPDDPKAAPADRVRDVIALLLDEREARSQFHQALLTERAVMMEFVDSKAAGTWIIRPLAEKTKLQSLIDFHAILAAAGATDAVTARNILGPIASGTGDKEINVLGFFDEDDDIPRYSRWFENAGAGGLWRALEQHARISAERRVTAISLAARLYRTDHGRWPGELRELAPSYLPAIPTDPFLAGGEPFRYVIQRGVLPDGGDRPLVYFDAEDGVADVIKDEPMFGWQGKTRQYRDLALWQPANPSFDEAAYQEQLRKEAVDKDGDAPDAPGNDEEENSGGESPAEI